MPTTHPHDDADSREKHRQLLLDFESLEPAPLQLMSIDDIFDKCNEELLRMLSEDRRIERKTSRFSGEKLGRYFSMWANTVPNGGLIVIGQRDAGAFEGCLRLSSDQLNDREKTGFVFCPDARHESKRIPVTNDRGEPDFVLLFRVRYHQDLVVRTSSSSAYVRRGDSCVELKPEEIRELQADKGALSFERQPVELAWPDDFDMDKVSSYVAAVRTARDIPPTRTVEEVLVLRHLGHKVNTSRFSPNIACALLFAYDPLPVIPGCKIRFQRFEGEHEGTGDKYNAVKDVILEGTVPSLILQIDQVLDSQLRTFAPLDSNLKFVPTLEYPKVAWYEAIVNACVHRSYGNGMRNMPIFVKMFDDRLVIESPGAFPPFVTPENIYESHHPKNPILMDAMFYLEYVRCAHEGTRRIRDTMAQQELPPPEFRQQEQGPAVVRVTLRNNAKQRRAWVDHDVSKVISEAIAAGFTEEERRAVNIAAANPELTVSDVNKALDISWSRAKKLLTGLARKRVLQYIRFREYGKDKRDPKAYFRLRSNVPLPKGAFEQPMDDN